MSIAAIPVLNDTLKVADGDVGQYTFIKYHTTENACVPAVAKGVAHGVALEAKSAGTEGDIAVGLIGIYPVYAVEAISAGAEVAVGASSWAKTAGAGEVVVGYARSGATAGGELIRVLINGGQIAEIAE